MSVVITKVYNGNITMAADTAVTTFGGCTVYTSKEGKIIDTPELIVGVVGSAEHITILKAFFSKYKMSDPTYLGIYEAMKEYYTYLIDLPINMEDDESKFHLVYRGRAWVIEGLLVEPIEEYHAMGCGKDTAWGALDAGASVRDAVTITCRHNQHCEMPMDSVSMNETTYEISRERLV